MKLLQQNSHLKRLLGEQEIASAASTIIQANDEANIAAATITPASIHVQTTPGGGLIKKRKLGDHLISMQTISDSSDEGLGSMSPEPVTLIAAGGLSHAVTSKVQQTTIATPNNSQSVTKEVNQLRTALETELKNRTSLEDRIQQLEQDMKRAQKQMQYPSQFYSQREIIERDNLHHDEVSVVEIETQDENGQHLVLCSTLEDLEEEEETEEMREEVIISDDSEMAQYVEVR